MGTEIEQLSQIERALAEVVNAPEVNDIIAAAEAMRRYTKQRKLGISLVNYATQIKLRAERKLAQIVQQGQKAGTITTNKDGGRPSEKSPDSGDIIRKQSLPDLGISSQRLSESRAIAQALTDDDIKKMAEDATANGEELTRSSILKAVRQKSSTVVEESGKKFEDEYADQLARLEMGPITLGFEIAVEMHILSNKIGHIVDDYQRLMLRAEPDQRKQIKAIIDLELKRIIDAYEKDVMSW